MFRPPMTPSGSSYYNSCPSQNQELSVARKRLCADSYTTQQSSPVSVAYNPLCENNSVFLAHQDHAATPAPLANPTYVLAGGHDTPSLDAAAHYDCLDARDDLFRGKWEKELDSPFAPVDLLRGPLSRERNGHSRLSSGTHVKEHRQTGWSSYVFSVATNVAGKIVNFCRDGAFRGFHAGRDKGYDLPRPSQLDEDHIWDGYFRSSKSNTHLPNGRDFSGDFLQDSIAFHKEQDSNASRPAKRLHLDNGNGWVFVQSNLDTQDASPRLTARKTSQPLLSADQSVAYPPSPRRSLIPVSRRMIASTGSPTLPQSSDFTKYERHVSLAPTRSPTRLRPSTKAGPGDLAPLSPQAKKILAKRAREDRETDKSMSKMSKQLQDLIRQGRAALGTTVAVDDLHDDDGDLVSSVAADGWEDAGVEAGDDRW